MNNEAQTPPGRPKNIVISGTNFWNPGDDFVRDGVIRILRNVFGGVPLNFLFYNFNADFFPQDKFSGIANCAAQGDLEKYRDFVDAVVIAGLSAGDEIKDLYDWVVANGLEEKVYLIGAGYENDYVAKHITEEPEATIFRKARLVTGRTAKTPEFIRAAGIPYFHLNCPAILSVPEVKRIGAGQKIQRIGFSIQLPHGEGLANHSCAAEQYELAVAVLRDLSRQYEVEVVAHHKTEYFHFLHRLRGTRIPVIFSSFYQDLHQIYPRYDLVVTTRLHASLFANGHGIPGIIINDTDRHTHTLDGFPHSTWVNHRAAFEEAFARWGQADLAAIAREAGEFKRGLLAKYISVLGEAFNAGPRPAVDGYAFDSEKKEQRLVRSLVPPGAVVFDVGANIGKYTKLFSLLAGPHGKVFAFEPDPGSGARLQGLVAQDGLANVTVVKAAVSEAAGQAVLNRFPEEYSSWNGLGQPNMEDPKNPSQFVPIVSSVEVAAVALDDFCRAQEIRQIDYLKLDVEGAELRALNGARQLLARQAIRQVQFEVSQKMLEGLDTTAKPVFELLASFGYECHAISPAGEIAEVVTDSQAFFDNYLALPAKPAVLPADDDGALPVHFFTIVLNGQPFIQHHLQQLRQLPFRWHWHIIEGVADLKHDTAWSVKDGGKIPAADHRNGLSIDGTTEYLDRLERENPDRISIYRKLGALWDGKLEMVNAPLKHIQEGCLLWQVDADELWTAEQIIRARALFLAHPEKTAARYRCHFFVGQNLLVSTRGTYGNRQDEWLRTWRYEPGCEWTAHEPPTLVCRGGAEGGQDLGANAFTQDETEAVGLVFHHYAYATEAQVKFKESYYGYHNAVMQWRQLQTIQKFPALLADYFAWVDDGAEVSSAQALGIDPIVPAQWFEGPSAATPARKPFNPVLLARRVEYVKGVHPPEGPMRWLSNHSEIRVPAHLLTGPVNLSFALSAGDLWCYGRPFQVVVSLAGKTLRRLLLERDGQKFDLTTRIEPQPEAQLLTIECSASFVPAEIDGKSRDQRRLAVKLTGLAFVEVPGTPKVETRLAAV